MENNDKNEISEILDVVNTMSTHIDERFDKMDERFDKMDERFDKMEADVSTLKADMVTVKATMVDKDYLDHKLADTKADILVAIHKEDLKLQELVKILQEKQILSEPDVKRVLSMYPYPKLYV